MMRAYDVIPEEMSASDCIATELSGVGLQKLLGWVIRTTEPLRPKIDFSFVKIRYSDSDLQSLGFYFIPFNQLCMKKHPYYYSMYGFVKFCIKGGL